MPAVRTQGRVHKSTLAGRPSPYDSSVTLYEPATRVDTTSGGKSVETNSEPGGSNGTSALDEEDVHAQIALRRSPRKRSIVQPQYAEESGTMDIEDSVPYVSPVKRARKTASVTPRALKATTSRFSTSEPSPTKASGKNPLTLSPKKRKPTKMALATSHPEPEHWQEVYDAIKRMRTTALAPVDTMGCHMAGEGETDPTNKRFAILASLMLSPQTKDEVTDAAVRKLRTAVGGVLSVDALLASSEEVIQGAINKVGFWRKKASYIQDAAQILKDQHNGEVPQDIDELCALPGVGEKIAFLTLLHAWELNIGIGVDTHVQRITNRLGWHKPPTTTEEKTRLNLQSWLPLEQWREINSLFVGFGQTICQPQRPRCEMCELSTRGLCPSAAPLVGVKAKKAKPPRDAPAALAVKDDVDGTEGAPADVAIALEEMGETT